MASSSYLSTASHNSVPRLRLTGVSGWSVESVRRLDEHSPDLRSIVDRPDFDAYADQQIESELAVSEIVRGMEAAPDSSGSDPRLETIRLGVRDESGRIYRSACAAAAFAVAATFWGLDAAMNGDFSPVASLLTGIVLYRYLRSR